MTKGKTLVFSFIAILLPVLLYSVFRFSIGPLVPVLQLVFSMSNPESGLLLSLQLATVGVGVGLSGIVSRKIGEEKTAILGLLVFSISLGLSTFLSSQTIFSIFFVINGLGGGLMTTPTYSIAANLLPKRKGTAIGFVSASYNLGGFVGPILSGFLLSTLGWQYPLLGTAVLGLIFAFLFHLGLSSHESPARAKVEEVIGRGLKSIVKSRNMLALGLSMLLADFAFLTYISWTVKYLDTIFQLSEASRITVDFYFGIAVGIGGIGIIVAGTLFDKIGGKKTSLLSGVAATILTLGLYLSNSFSLAVMLMFAVGFFSNWFWGILSAMAQANVPAYDRASAVSFVQTIAFVGAVFGPFMAGSLFGETVSALPLILTVTIPYLVFAILILIFYTEPAKEKIPTSNEPL